MLKNDIFYYYSRSKWAVEKPEISEFVGFQTMYSNSGPQLYDL